MHISDVLHSKGDGVVTIDSESSVRELIRKLAEHNVGALVVTRSDGSLVGIVSERDVVRQLDREAGALDQPVSTIMTTDVETCQPSDLVDDLMAVMTRRRIRHLPVLVDGQLGGIVSIGDVVKMRIGELEFEREQLSSYISSAG